MNTDKLIEELEKIRSKYKLERIDEDTLKVTMHRLKTYKRIIKEHPR